MVTVNELGRATDRFGPAVIFGFLMSAGVRFYYYGYVTHYAEELCRARLPAIMTGTPMAESHQDNVERLTRALVTLEAHGEAVGGRPRPFDGSAAALAGQPWFETPHGSVRVSIHDELEAATLDPIAARVRICVDTPLSVLRSHEETGRFPGLEKVVRIVELFESS